MRCFMLPREYQEEVPESTRYERRFENGTHAPFLEARIKLSAWQGLAAVLEWWRYGKLGYSAGAHDNGIHPALYLSA